MREYMRVRIQDNNIYLKREPKHYETKKLPSSEEDRSLESVRPIRKGVDLSIIVTIIEQR